ncbi:MAG: choloylglycine hydrolase [Butyrivibrio sp.]|nr:choloylglycine hydrolase [Acetatifactor muris]MCM1560145.1 choloylglycine hydrolase [Butyrivibrio sp.]
MCTAAAFQSQDFYFGRNLDYEYSYHEEVVITPRNYPFRFRHQETVSHHYAMIGMAYAVGGYPLYYEATNEAGLSMAGLNFPGNADYKPLAEGKDNIASFEFIPWILSQCATIPEAKLKLTRLNLAATPFSRELPPSPLHWIISGRDGSITVESVKEGLKVYDNPVGVLTNNPPFDYHMTNLSNYMSLSVEPPENHFGEKLPLTPYSRGMGAMGLPGDLSSASRFVKAAFTLQHSCCGASEAESVSQFFHILTSVEQQRGCVHMGDGQYEITIYSCCCNADKGIYYYTTYENSRISAVDMRRENLEGSELIAYPVLKEQDILMQNQSIAPPQATGN